MKIKRAFSKRTKMERAVLQSVNRTAGSVTPLPGLGQQALAFWLQTEAIRLPLEISMELSNLLRELAALTGALADQSRVVVRRYGPDTERQFEALLQQLNSLLEKTATSTAGE